MTLKNEVLKKIPGYLKEEPEFKVLLEHIKKEEMKSKEELSNFLKKEINLVDEWIRENKKRGGTMVKNFRDKAVRLEILKKCEKLMGEFLL